MYAFMIDIKILIYFTNYYMGGLMNQEEIREKLSTIVSSGLSANSISKVTNISNIDLSRFKNGQIYLIDSDLKKLNSYLEQVKIPTSI